MPFFGGASPSPRRYGGGEGINSAIPLLQRVYETIARGRGSAYDQSWPPTTAVGIENLAYARALVYDGWGTNQRLANECNPAKATAAGLLPRWERILGCPPNYGDTEPVRRARCAARLASFGKAPIGQAVIDVLTSLLGALFVGVTHADDTNDTAWWPGLTGTGATVSSVSGNLATIGGLTDVPTAAPGNLATFTGFGSPTNNGTFPIKSWVSSTSIVIVNNFAPFSGDSGGVWTLSNPNQPWTSTICNLNVEVTQNVNGYYSIDPTSGDSVPNAAFYAKVAQIGSVLDLMLPAHMTWQFYILAPGGASGFILDTNNLDLEVFDV